MSGVIEISLPIDDRTPGLGNQTAPHLGKQELPLGLLHTLGIFEPKRAHGFYFNDLRAYFELGKGFGRSVKAGASPNLSLAAGTPAWRLVCIFTGQKARCWRFCWQWAGSPAVGLAPGNHHSCH